MVVTRRTYGTFLHLPAAAYDGREIVILFGRFCSPGFTRPILLARNFIFDRYRLISRIFRCTFTYSTISWGRGFTRTTSSGR